MDRSTDFCSDCSEKETTERNEETGYSRIRENLFTFGALSQACCVLVPLIVTVTLFLVLYNNVSSGRLILLLLMSINLAVVFVPAHSGLRSEVLRPAKPLALWLFVGLVTAFGIELAFPMLLPLRYAEIRDLSKQWSAEHFPAETEGAILFTNSDQRIHFRASPRQCAVKSKLWHSAGGEFAYYGYDPNSKTRYVNLFHWNSRGYFDHDYETSRPPETARIMVVGDSYVEAMQVPLARTFHKMLEHTLNHSADKTGSGRYEVVALGSAGTGQGHHLKVLTEESAALNPDTVVFTLCSNDFCDDDPELKKEFDLAFGAITPTVRRLVSHGFFAAAFACRRIEDIQKNKIIVSPELLQWTREDIPRVESAWTRSLEYIQEARDFCEQKGISFMLIYIGSDLEVKYALDPAGTIERLRSMGGPHKEINWDLDKSVRRVTNFCTRNNIRLVSMLGPLTAAQKKTGKQVFGDHYTLFGHQIVAQVLRCALDHNSDKLAHGDVPFTDCISPDAWSVIAPVAGLEEFGESPGPIFVPAAGPASESR